MFCSNCGNKLPDGAKFCDACGAAVEASAESCQTAPVVENEPTVQEPKGGHVTENIVFGTDGKLHWYYEFKLMKNPTVLKLLWKIFFWIFIVMWVFLSIVNLSEGHFNMKDFLDFSKIFLLLLVGVEVLVALGYFIYAAIQGFKYCVMFEMDEEGVKHTQMPKQFKKAQAMSVLTMLMGAVSGKPGAVGTGMLAASKQSMVSNWKSVKSVEIDAKHNVIKVNERMNKNQVYAEDADFEYVVDYIKSHVSKKCKVK
ncbi:MAG: zinc ribbon domain-containing protein [Bacteroidia bacterium]|nr:zinc ribbon domain-containing protein [Bacteroidia bacterium]